MRLKVKYSESRFDSAPMWSRQFIYKSEMRKKIKLKLRGRFAQQINNQCCFNSQHAASAQQIQFVSCLKQVGE